MNPLLLSSDETATAQDDASSFSAVELSPTEIAINHWIDIVAKYLDRYLVTPLLGPNQSAVR